MTKQPEITGDSADALASGAEADAGKEKATLVTSLAYPISDAMIAAAARILEDDPFCEMSPTIAEGLAQEILKASLTAEYDRLRNK